MQAQLSTIFANQLFNNNYELQCRKTALLCKRKKNLLITLIHVRLQEQEMTSVLADYMLQNKQTKQQHRFSKLQIL